MMFLARNADALKEKNLGCSCAEWDVFLSAAAEECANMEAALLAVAVQNEPNPAKINWNC